MDRVEVERIARDAAESITRGLNYVDRYETESLIREAIATVEQRLSRRIQAISGRIEVLREDLNAELADLRRQ